MWNYSHKTTDNNEHIVYHLWQPDAVSEILPAEYAACVKLLGSLGVELHGQKAACL